jgi:exodeoxyribonuclease V beta subunit
MKMELKMTNSSISTFNLASPELETGRIVIEASAGTGKTYSLTVLAIRHIAERNLTADQLLMVTFTISATAELREKTRQQAQETLQHLRDKNPQHPWMASMLATETARLSAISNLEQFLAHFDQATITTIHGFCQIVLKRAGLHSPAPPNYTVQDNVDEVINQVITDMLIDPMSKNARLLHGEMNMQAGGVHPLKSADVRKSLSNLHDAVKRYMGNHKALLLPALTPSLLATKIDLLTNDKDIRHTTQAETIARFVRQVVEEVQRRSYVAGIITYDDMVRMVAETLDKNDESAKNLATSIAKQYSLVMVDEFQDTDASQWSIFSHIYQANPRDVTLVTVGDPKQAIYRFRGADVQVYIDAVHDVQQSHALGTNYRSDKDLLTALDSLLKNNTFDGAGNVPFVSVHAAKSNENGAVTAVSSPAPNNVPGAPLEIRYLANHPDLGAREEPGKKKNDGTPGKTRFFNNDKENVQRIFWRDVANHIVELLEHGNIPDKKAGGGATREITPNDIAILVNSHAAAETAVHYLRESHVPAVRFKTDSVFGSQAAMHWLMLLGALANPGKPQFVRAYALSWFGNVSEDDLALATDEDVANWQRSCAENADLLQTRGMSALYLSFRNRAGFLQRVLSEPNGERHITDLDHLAEILAALPHFTRNAGADECFEKLSELVEESDGSNEAFQRRIEGDEVAVKVMTIHSSKGLQFPIVFLPTLINKPPAPGSNPKMFSFRFTNESSARRIIDVASGYKSAEDWVFDPTGNKDLEFEKIYKRDYTKKKVKLGREHLSKEDVFYDSKRLAYVALTRAEHKVILYWSACGENNGKGNIHVALAQILATHIDPVDKKIPVEKESLDVLMKTIAASSNGSIAAISLPNKQAPTLEWVQPIGTNPSTTNTALFLRTNEVRTYGFARWSYSAFSKMLHGIQQDNNIVDVGGATDESNGAPELPPLVSEVNIPLDVAVSTMPLYDIAGSNIFGNAVHEIFDSINPACEDLLDDVTDQVERRFKNTHSTAERVKIIEGIIASIHAPLGGPFAGNTLKSLGTKHRLSELEFNFHLPQTTAGSFSLNKIGELMLQHGNLDARLTTYAQEITESASSGNVAGFMTGFIDAVFRVNADGSPVYVVADYKTNRLHSPAKADENPLIAYHPDNLVVSMVKDNYIIQALVYSVALHRYLQWRQPGYDPDTHLGGAAYLYTRGMTGHSTDEPAPRPYGVYHWRPATKLVLALDALFAEKGN